jgi:hypothetical protein
MFLTVRKRQGKILHPARKDASKYSTDWRIDDLAVKRLARVAVASIIFQRDLLNG